MSAQEQVREYIKAMVDEDQVSERFARELECYLMDLERDRGRYRLYMSFWWGLVLATGVIGLAFLFAKVL
jgi:hypothetical protein